MNAKKAQSKPKKRKHKAAPHGANASTAANKAAVTAMRWHIRGKLILTTPMHIGTGEDETIEGIEHTVDAANNAGVSSVPTWVAAITRDHLNRPYVPGASLKGALRALARRCGLSAAEIEPLFGGDEVNLAAGRVQFCNLYLDTTRKQTESGLPAFDIARQTALVPRSSIDRDFGTVVAKKLFQEQVVPPGAAFRFECTIDSVRTQTVETLLGLLNRAGDQDHGIRLGSGKTRQAGRVKWCLDSVCSFGPTECQRWLADIQQGRQQTWSAFANERTDLRLATINAQKEVVEISVQLKFHTPFLVANPDKQGNGGANLTPRHNHRGVNILPASGFRGPLRAQAERILRTLGWTATRQGHAAHPHRIGAPFTDLASLLFGTSGWRGVIECDDFTRIGATREYYTQEFVAIDRFSGGGKDTAKFNAKYAECPNLIGKIRIDLTRLRNASPTITASRGTAHDTIAAALGLLALVLRDLDEGDITFGYGSGKGYGNCKATSLGAYQKKLGDIARSGPAAFVDVDTALAVFHEHYQHAGVTNFQPVGAANIDAPGLSPGRPQGDFHNPYTFLPVEPPANADEWAEWTGIADSHHSHARYSTHHGDLPVFHGRIVCRLEAKTPIFVGAARDDNTAPVRCDNFRLFDKINKITKIALPATSLRGALSSLGAALSQSGLRVLENRALSSRVRPKQALSAIAVVRERMGIVAGDVDYFLEPIGVPTLTRADTKFRSSPGFGPVFAKALDGLRSFVDILPAYHNAKDLYYLPVRRLRHHLTICASAICANADNRLDHAYRFPSDNVHKNYLIGRCTVYGAAPITQEQFDELASPTEKAQHERGFVRTLSDPGRDLPNQVKHHLFIPYPVWRDSANDTDKGLIPLSPAIVDLFHELADERTGASPRLTGLARLPYEPINADRHSPVIPADRTDKKGQLLRNALRLKDGDIVYFDVDETGQPTQISFSAIWRIAVLDQRKRYSTRDFWAAIDDRLPPLDRDSERTIMSPAEMMFGFVQDGKAEDDPTAKAFKSKVRFGYGLLKSNAPADDPLGADVTLKILSSPKPPSPAMYFSLRGSSESYVSKAQLATTPAKYRPKGRKVYLHAPRDNNNDVRKLNTNGTFSTKNEALFPWESNPENDNNSDQKAVIRPIRQGTVFYFETDFLNLDQRELQNLCAALEPHSTYEHKIGMGKPIGLGSVKISPVGMFLIDRIKRYSEDPLGAPRYHNGWKAGEAGTDEWPVHLAREKNMQPSKVAIDPRNLASVAMAQLPMAMRNAVLLTGNPNAVTKPVHYPQLDQEAIETKTYRWFVENDRDGNKIADNRRSSLGEIGQTTNALPVLKRTPIN